MRPPPPILRLLQTSVTLLPIIGFFLLAAIPSCSTQAENDRLQRISDIAIGYAERRGAISPQDAADLREAGKIVLTKDASTQPPVAPVEAK